MASIHIVMLLSAWRRHRNAVSQIFVTRRTFLSMRMVLYLERLPRRRIRLGTLATACRGTPRATGYRFPIQMP